MDTIISTDKRFLKKKEKSEDSHLIIPVGQFKKFLKNEGDKP